MHAFQVMAVGNLAKNPEMSSGGEHPYCRFRLIGSDYAGKDANGIEQEITTGVDFVAFGALGETIANHTLKGDQLIVEAHMRHDNWTDKQGEKHYGYSYVVDGFRFGNRVRQEPSAAAA